MRKQFIFLDHAINFYGSQPSREAILKDGGHLATSALIEIAGVRIDSYIVETLRHYANKFLYVQMAELPSGKEYPILHDDWSRAIEAKKRYDSRFYRYILRFLR